MLLGEIHYDCFIVLLSVKLAFNIYFHYTSKVPHRFQCIAKM